MSDKSFYLREMGLGPVWRLREQAGEAAKSAPLTRELAAATAPLDWQQLAEAVAGCRRCALYEARKQVVFGAGDPHADWLFVGEGPGEEEDLSGQPFVGQSGKLLDAMLAAIQLKRGDNTYITNAVKCHPPENRSPATAEIEACNPYLRRQIALIKPRLIVALGRPAAQALLGRSVKISEVRGQLFEVDGVPLIVTYHPAYLLRNLPDKARAWEDFLFARQTMKAFG